MLNIDQYILLIIQKKTEKMEEFKDYIKASNFPEKKISCDEWETIYLSWIAGPKDDTKNDDKMIEIYLNDD